MKDSVLQSDLTWRLRTTGRVEAIEVLGRHWRSATASPQIVGTDGSVFLVKEDVAPAPPSALMASDGLLVGQALPQAFHDVSQPRRIHPCRTARRALHRLCLRGKPGNCTTAEVAVR